MAEATDLRAGTRVSWNTSQGRTRGVVVRKATKDMKIKSFAVRASRDDPKYVVRSDSSGELAAHTAGSLRVLKRH